MRGRWLIGLSILLVYEPRIPHTNYSILVGRKKNFACLRFESQQPEPLTDRSFLSTLKMSIATCCLQYLLMSNRLGEAGQYQHEIFGNTQNEHCHMVFTSWCPIDLVKQADWWELFINPQHEHCHLLCTSWCPIDLARQADRQELRLSRDHLAPWIGLHSPSLHHLQ